MADSFYKQRRMAAARLFLGAAFFPIRQMPLSGKYPPGWERPSQAFRAGRNTPHNMGLSYHPSGRNVNFLFSKKADLPPL